MGIEVGSGRESLSPTGPTSPSHFPTQIQFSRVSKGPEGKLITCDPPVKMSELPAVWRAGCHQLSLAAGGQVGQGKSAGLWEPAPPL